MQADQHDITRLIEAHARISEALAAAQSDLANRIDRVNSDDSRRMAQSNKRLSIMVAVLTALVLFMVYRDRLEFRDLYDSSNATTREALDANVAASLAEARINAVEAKQKAINEAVYKRLNAQDEEILNGTRRP